MLCSTKAEAKIEENKKRMQGHGEKVSNIHAHFPRTMAAVLRTTLDCPFRANATDHEDAGRASVKSGAGSPKCLRGTIGSAEARRTGRVKR